MTANSLAPTAAAVSPLTDSFFRIPTRKALAMHSPVSRRTVAMLWLFHSFWPGAAAGGYLEFFVLMVQH